MKRSVQLFHEVTGAREYLVADETVSVKDFVFSVVEELRDQDTEFFEVYSDDGSRIGDRKVEDVLGPYIVVCDIISAGVSAAQRAGEKLWIRRPFHERLRGYLESFTTVETCGFLLGARSDDTPEYMIGVFPSLDLQTRNDAVVGSEHLALIHLAVRSAVLPGRELAFAWIHTHLDTPPRLSLKDRKTLARLRSLAPKACALIFNQRYPELGIVGYTSNAARIALNETPLPPVDDGLPALIQDAITAVYTNRGKEPPRFIT